MKLPIALCAALSLFSSTALAHVTANPNHGTAGEYFQTSFRVSHGCEGTDTTRISISIPSGFLTLKPQHKSGWKVETKKRKLPAPVASAHGKMTDEEFSEVTWSGNNLPNDQYDEFGILVKLPNGINKTLYFPVTQSCVKGEHKWSDIPNQNQKWHDLKNPAPFVDVTAPAEKSSHHAH